MLKAIDRADLAQSMGLPEDSDGGPSRSGLASSIRAIVASKGAIRRSELVDWGTRLCVAVGYPMSVSQLRFGAVLDLLLAANDIAALETGEGQLIIAAPSRRISLGNDNIVLLGVANGDDGDAFASTDGRLLRKAPPHGDVESIFDFLGPPEFADHFPEVEFPDGLNIPVMERLFAEFAIRASLGDFPGRWDRVSRLAEKNVYLMTDGGGEFAVGIETTEGCIPRYRLRDQHQVGWLYLSGKGLSALSDWPGNFRMPRQILRALAVLASPLDDKLCRWSISGEALDLLASWLGYVLPDEVHGLDSAQDEVVFAPVAARLVVEAGPGSGKTWTACRRVSQLVNDGVAPSRIVLLSFTRAAVAELRDRIAGFLESPDAAADIQIMTLDAFAWRLGSATRSGLPHATGHDASVRQVIGLLAAGERDLVDYLGRIEHLVVDEAQDLTELRRDLVIGLLEHLSADCGVTVFHDPAQAIYGFTGGGSSGIVSRLSSGDAFRTIILFRDYRTQSLTLRNLIASARSLLTEVALPAPETYRTLRDNIEKAAQATAGLSTGTPADGRTFILFRSRAEVLSAACGMLAAGRHFRMRLPRGAEHVEPWIGAILGNFDAGPVSREAVREQFEDTRPLPLLPWDETWSILRRIAPSGSASIDPAQVACVVSSPTPPVAITQTDLGFHSGPLLSTIHAAKGREADTVHLMMPRYPERDDTNWQEEARVLFVGASRARKTLRIGSHPSWFRRLGGGSGRLWQKSVRYGRTDAVVEVGIPDDVDVAAQFDDTLWGGNKAVAEAQERLWRHAFRPARLRAIRKGARYELLLDGGADEGTPVGFLSAQFSNDLWSIGELVCDVRTPPPAQITGIYLLAVSTVSQLASYGDVPRLGLSPVVVGTPLIYLDRSR